MHNLGVVLNLNICYSSESEVVVIWYSFTKTSVSFKKLWFTLENMMAALQARIAHSLKIQDKAGGSNLEKRLQSAGAVRSANSASAEGEHPDSRFVKPLLIPTIIIGGKYDIFQGKKRRQAIVLIEFCPPLYSFVFIA